MGVTVGWIVDVIVGCGDGETVCVAVAVGLSTPLQPPIVVAMTTINDIPQNEPLISILPSVDGN
jgi:hypothetical protein